MCGICGYVGKKKISDETLWKMNNTISHRGPDDGGIFQIEKSGYYFGFGHRRLSILDLSEAGHQPMTDSTGRYTIVFNGEIYNFLELRLELEKNGIKFVSNCDTEVLLYGLIVFGEALLTRLDGMYSFAFFDKVEESILLARDKTGEKPLYYYWDGKFLIFGSELKPIINCPEFKKEIRREIIGDYLVHNSITPPNTIFQNTYKLCTGELLIWKNGVISKRQYYDVIEQFKIGKEHIVKDYDTAKSELKKRLYASVEKRLIADVPTGCFLSGGIDSTLVSAIANEIKPGGIDTFCIGFTDEKINEAPFANNSAKYLGTHHHEWIMEEQDLFHMIEDLPKYYDEPFADSSQLATMLVAQFAKEKVTVALSGDGGDEYFAGYQNIDVYTKLSSYRKYTGLLQKISNRKIQDCILEQDALKMFGTLVWDDTDKRLVQVQEYVRESVARRILKENPAQKSSILSFNNLEKIDDLRERRMVLDMMSYLPDEVLVKTDRASMKYALEMRAPLLSLDITEYSFRLPFEMKFKDGKKKYILKDILSDFLPAEMMDRPKMGFGVPIRTWMNTSLSKQLLRFADKEILDKQGIFEHEGIMWLISKVKNKENYRYQASLWCFFVFQLWYQEYVENLWG